MDNLIRHHDYNVAVIEAARDFEMARYWMHGGHLLSKGHKMAKSLGNEYYTSTLMDMGYSAEEIRFGVINYPYRQSLDFSPELMAQSSQRLRVFRAKAAALRAAAKGTGNPDTGLGSRLTAAFETHMNEDLNVQGAFTAMEQELAGIDPAVLSATEAADAIAALEKIDGVLQVIF